MRRTRFDTAHCPVARTTDLLGDWWTPLVLRQLFVGERRFAQIAESLDISRAILSSRLKRLESEGVVAKVQYEEHPPRFEYHLTDKGVALWDVVAAMWRFGDDWMFDESPGAQVVLVDKETQKRVQPQMIDANTGQPLTLATTRVRPRTQRKNQGVRPVL